MITFLFFVRVCVVCVFVCLFILFLSIKFQEGGIYKVYISTPSVVWENFSWCLFLGFL